MCWRNGFRPEEGDSTPRRASRVFGVGVTGRRARDDAGRTRRGDAATRDAMVCPKGTRTKGLTKKYAHNARVAALKKRARTEAHRRKAAFVEAALERLAARDAAEGRESARASDAGGTPTVVGVMPARETARRATIDAEAYREATRAASSAAAVASTSGGLIGKLAFDGASDVALETRAKGGGEREGEGREPRIGTAARKKKKKNKKLNARKARRC